MNELIGKVIRGYEVHEPIGFGGFGTVYRAYQPIVQREVAVKIIRPERASLPEFIHRFETEAQMVARLEHLHIVPLYDYWRDPDGAYLVMRYLRGGSLQRSLAQHGAWEMADIARLLDQITSALALAHSNGIIHRDLKPGNILLDKDGNTFLTDFGIAKDLHKSAEVLPEEGHLGSPAYISPEQVLREQLSPQTDIYSLGVILFELLTGQRPFEAATETTVMRHHVIRVLPSVYEIRPELSKMLDIVVQRATAKHPEDRYADVRQLATDFRSIAGFMGTISVPPFKTGVAVPDRPVAPDVNTKTLIVETIDLGEGTRNIIPDAGTRDIETLNLPVVPAVTRNPYKGLRSFDEADASDFFGRDALVIRLLVHLKKERFLAVVGPSGSGKSSVVKAGLIPGVRRKAIVHSDEWFVAQMTPGTQPLQNLQDALLRVAVRVPEKMEDHLAEDVQGLHDTLIDILPTADDQLVLVIDQFEELFTLVKDVTARDHFMNMLAAAVAAPDSRLRLVITLRADFYDRPLLHPVFGDLIRQYTEVVLPLSPDELRDAIITPAKRVGLELEAPLVDAIIEDVHVQPGALPLLQYALTELFERRVGQTLTLQAYRDIGGVPGALARRADTLYEALKPAEKHAAQQLFLRLITLGIGTEDTRRRLVQAELQSLGDGSVQAMIDLFGQHRLLTFDRDPFTRAPTVEIAHEALIQQWDRLVRWLAESRAALQVQRRMALEVDEWLLSGRNTGFLASGSRLAQYEALAGDTAVALTEDEITYLGASSTRRQQAENRQRLGIIALVVFSVVALGLALLALDRERRAEIQRVRADQEAAVARSRELAVRSLTRIEDDLDGALVLSLEALDQADTFEARNSLLTALQAQPNLSSFLHGHTDAVRTVAFDPQGNWLASAGRDNTIILWDLTTRQMAGMPLLGHDDWVNDLAFSPDGHTLASAAADGTVGLWAMPDGVPIGEPITSHEGAVWAVSFTDDGRSLAFAGEDSLIHRWDVQAAVPIGQPLTGHRDFVFSLDAHADRLLSGSADGTVRVWDLLTGEFVGQPLVAHSDWVLSVAFSPDGETIASGGADQTVYLWDAATGTLQGQVTGYTDWVRSVAFSPDSSQLIAGSADGSVYTYDLETAQNVALGQHSDAVWAAQVSPDGTLIASGGADNQVILWDASGQGGLSRIFARQAEAVSSLALHDNMLASANGNPAGEGTDYSIQLWDITTGEAHLRLDGHRQAVTAVAFSPDGSHLASASADQTVMLWELASDSVLSLSLTGHTDAVMAVAYQPNGQVVASGGFDNTIRLWDAATGAPIGQPLTGHADAVLTLAFSPDGDRLVSGSFDSTIRLWDSETGLAVGEPLTGHTDAVTQVVFNADGTLLASTSRDASVLLWDISAEPELIGRLVGHQNWVLSAAFHPTEPLLATSSRDQTVILWDLTTQQPLGQPLTAHTDWVSAVTFSPDGASLFSGSHDLTVRQWQTRLTYWRGLACRVANPVDYAPCLEAVLVN